MVQCTSVEMLIQIHAQNGELKTVQKEKHAQKDNVFLCHVLKTGYVQIGPNVIQKEFRQDSVKTGMNAGE